MFFSHYLKKYPAPGHPDHWLLFSTKRSSIALITKTLFERIERGAATSAEIEPLVRLGVLVADLEAEKEELRGVLDRAAAVTPFVNVCIVLNLDCNLGCVYCYEEGFRHGQYMNDATAAGVVELLRGQMTKGKRVSVGFYGGEALLSLDRIKEISILLKETEAQGSGGYDFNIITNGTLLTRETVEELIPLGLARARVTVDGPPEIHDRQRPFTSGSGSFATIIRNIQEVANLLPIHLVGNFREGNYRDFPRLLDYLLEAGLTPERLPLVQFGPVTKQVGMAEFSSDCSSANEPWLAEATLYLREEILRRGFKTLKARPNACMVELEHNLVINWDGSLYKCPAFMDDPEASIGTVKDGIRDHRASHGLRAWQNDDCLCCAYLPLCFGGCRFLNLLQGKGLSELECRRELYDQSLEQIVLQDYRYSAARPKTP